MSFPSRYAPPQRLNERPCDHPATPDTPNAAVSPHGFTEGPSSFSSAMPTSRLLPSLPSGLSIDLQASYTHPSPQSSTLGTVEGMMRPLVAVPSLDGAQQLSSVDANPHANSEWLEVLQLQEDKMLAHDARELSTDNADERNRAAARPYPVGEKHHRFDTLQTPHAHHAYSTDSGQQQHHAIAACRWDSVAFSALHSANPYRAIVETYGACDELHSPSYKGVVEANPDADEAWLGFLHAALPDDRLGEQ